MLKEQFNRLCRGERIRPFKYDKELQSYFLHHHRPFLKLGPFKLETMNNSPFLCIFHDFFHDTEIKAFIKYAQPNLKRSSFSGRKTGSIRTSKQVWAYSKSFQEEISVSSRISLATLQNTTSFSTDRGSAEPFQVIK